MFRSCRSARLVYRVAERGQVRFDQRVVGDVGKGGRRADDDRAVRLERDALELPDAVDAHERAARELAFADLDEHVAAAADDDGGRVLHKRRDRVGDALCQVDFLDIVHPFVLPSIG